MNKEAVRKMVGRIGRSIDMSESEMDQVAEAAFQNRGGYNTIFGAIADAMELLDCPEGPVS